MKRTRQLSRLVLWIYKMIKQIGVIKPRGLYGKLFERLAELEKEMKGLPTDKFIPFSYVYLKLCRNFSISKQEIKEILFFLRDLGILEISRIGIKLIYNK